MGAAFRLLAVAVLGLTVLPAAALGATVERDTETGIITIIDDQVATADNITFQRTATLDVVSRVGGGVTTTTGERGQPERRLPDGRHQPRAPRPRQRQ